MAKAKKKTTEKTLSKQQKKELADLDYVIKICTENGDLDRVKRYEKAKESYQ